MVTDTPVGVLRVIVILPSRLDVAVPHWLRQTSTCTGPRARAMNLRLWIAGLVNLGLNGTGLLLSKARKIAIAVPF
jgi:hypothetical protein